MAKKSKKTSTVPTTAPTQDDLVWRARQDGQTLREAVEIQGDKRRLKRAATEMKAQVKAIQKTIARAGFADIKVK